jgi:dihydroflavonol-4-reductase
MKIIVVGGSGMIGGTAALHLQSEGHEVAISSRREPTADSGVHSLPFIRGSYQDDSISKDTFAEFDALVFTASVDPRDLPKGSDEDTFWKEMNTIAIPRFFERARDAGIRKVVNIGSFYPWAKPELIEGNSYIQMRLDVDNAVKALNTESFHTVSLNPPYVLGVLQGASRGSYIKILQYLRGELPDIPLYAPPGGSNYMTAHSLSQAISGALVKGPGGVSYLVGDQNLSFHEYLGLYVKALGMDVEVPLLNKPHPIFSSFAGFGGTLYYEPDPTPFDYARNDVERLVQEIVKTF